VAAAGSAAGVGNGFSSLANTLAAGYGNNSLGTIGSPALGSLGSGIFRNQWPHVMFRQYLVTETWGDTDGYLNMEDCTGNILIVWPMHSVTVNSVSYLTNCFVLSQKALH
jgi:hypothetical protein